MFDRDAKWALVAAAVTLALCGVGFRFAVAGANAYLAKEPVPLRDPLTNIPKRLGPWTASGQDIRLTAEIEQALGTDFYLDRVYEREGEDGTGARVGVHVVYYTGLIDAVPHVPDRCFVAGGYFPVGLPDNVDLPLDRTGWRGDREHVNLRTGEPYPLLTFQHRVTGDEIEVRMPVGEYRIRTTEFRASNDPQERIHAGYFFIANGQITPTPDGVRRFAFDLTTRYAYYAKIQFTMYASGTKGRDDFVETVADLADELLPHLMLCLPDWAEVEREPST